ncbi:MAG: sel1 repeat family protein [Deltaproteobacteria bacterium]|nr:sel1 repeat family protein [Deltaproteobacteria bacterium]
MGYMYGTGRGVAKSDVKAAEWYSKAAEQGHAKAQHSLGVMHFQGQGVIRDRRKGCDFWRAAGEQGHEQAIKAYNTSCSR